MKNPLEQNQTEDVRHWNNNCIYTSKEDIEGALFITWSCYKHRNISSKETSVLYNVLCNSSISIIIIVLITIVAVVYVVIIVVDSIHNLMSNLLVIFYLFLPCTQLRFYCFLRFLWDFFVVFTWHVPLLMSSLQFDELLCFRYALMVCFH